MLMLIAGVLVWPGGGARAVSITFSPGDVFVSLENGPVQCRLPDAHSTRAQFRSAVPVEDPNADDLPCFGRTPLMAARQSPARRKSSSPMFAR